MSDKRQELETRARQCMEGVKGLITEAKREGFHLEAKAYLGLDGEPKVSVAVLMR